MASNGSPPALPPFPALSSSFEESAYLNDGEWKVQDGPPWTDHADDDSRSHADSELGLRRESISPSKSSWASLQLLDAREKIRGLKAELLAADLKARRQTTRLRLLGKFVASDDDNTADDAGEGEGHLERLGRGPSGSTLELRYDARTFRAGLIFGNVTAVAMCAAAIFATHAGADVIYWIADWAVLDSACLMGGTSEPSDGGVGGEDGEGGEDACYDRLEAWADASILVLCYLLLSTAVAFRDAAGRWCCCLRRGLCFSLHRGQTRNLDAEGISDRRRRRSDCNLSAVGVALALVRLLLASISCMALLWLGLVADGAASRLDGAGSAALVAVAVIVAMYAPFAASALRSDRNHRAAVAVQLFWRAKRARDHLDLARVAAALRLARFQGARGVQSMYRGRRARKFAAVLRKARDMRHRIAATVLQQMWREHLAWQAHVDDMQHEPAVDARRARQQADNKSKCLQQ